MTFQKLNIIEPILTALKQEGYQTPTPIQQQAIPAILQGKDILACAQTGTGKTAAFTIPVIQKLHQSARPGRGKTLKTLILTPTRELAIQIGESFATYGRYLQLDHCVVFGGIAQKYQIDRIKCGVDIIIATPGRLLDLISQDLLVLKSVEFVVLDEADRMLDMGFAHEVKRICALLPQKKQTMLFSATLPKEIASLAGSILKNPVKVEVNPSASPVDTIEQSVYFVEKNNKINLLVSLLREEKESSVLVFSRTKHGADKIARALSSSGVPSESIHGNKSQFARVTTLNNFKERKTRVLVATDVAARGIDIEGLTHVFNFDLPEVAETYIHRIGRTGRAGSKGFAFSFVDSEQMPLLYGIERLINKKIAVISGHRYDEKLLPTQKPNTESTGELSGEDFRRQKRAKQLNMAAEKKGAPNGRPQRSTYSRTRGEVRSRPSNAIYATKESSFFSEGAYQKRSRNARPNPSTRRNFDAFSDFDETTRLEKPVRESSSYTQPVRSDSPRKSFNPNFNPKNNKPAANRSASFRKKR